ncbi:MAG: glycoside hydrolase family 25 protein [Bacteroides sp.]|nr:glycoside hydrolase family 25 protein [Bacteroides sp.]
MIKSKTQRSKPGKTKAKSRKKSVSASRRSVKLNKRSRKTKIVPRHTPDWLKALLAVMIVFVFAAGFYYFFIRPYSFRWKPCYGQKAYGVCMPYGYSIHGIDISHYQGNINWEELAINRTSPYPIHFVFMKATEGGDLSDKNFPQNFEKARQSGFIRGAYHFFTSKTDALKQAEFFIRTVKLMPGDLPPVLDVEVVGKRSKKELKESVKQWLLRVEEHYGVKPILYASYKFKNKYLNDSLLNTYPYWIAHYYVDSVRYEGKWNFWQHADIGRVPGIKESVDLNVYNGSLEELIGLTIPKTVDK